MECLLYSHYHGYTFFYMISVSVGTDAASLNNVEVDVAVEDEVLSQLSTKVHHSLFCTLQLLYPQTQQTRTPIIGDGLVVVVMDLSLRFS